MFGLIKELPYTIVRRESGEYVDGQYVRGEPTNINIMANIQPAKFDEIKKMIDGEITEDWLKIFTKSPLRTKREGDNGWDADRLIYFDEIYEIRKVKVWQQGHNTDHYHAVAARVELAPEGDTL